MTPDPVPDTVGIAVSFTRTLDALGIRYLIGGSLASSVHGEPRSTNDIDVVADLRSEHVDEFVTAISADYYVSVPAVQAAVRSGGSFNVIHTAAAIKVDVFIAGDDPFEAERLRQRQRAQVSPDPDGIVYVDTAEHTILRKLEWYRRGGEVSDRQWRDVVHIMRHQTGRLDADRLRSWAGKLAVSDLLERAMREAATG